MEKTWKANKELKKKIGVKKLRLVKQGNEGRKEQKQQERRKAEVNARKNERKKGQSKKGNTKLGEEISKQKQEKRYRIRERGGYQDCKVLNNCMVGWKLLNRGGEERRKE